MADLTELEWSYLAGIFDGEGNIFLQIKSDRAETCALNIRARIANTSEELMEWTQEKFGGNLTVYNGRTTNHKGVFQLAWYSRSEVARVLSGMLPYLIIKKWVAENVIGLLALPNNMPLEKLELAKLIKGGQHHER